MFMVHFVILGENNERFYRYLLSASTRGVTVQITLDYSFRVTVLCSGGKIIK